MNNKIEIFRFAASLSIILYLLAGLTKIASASQDVGLPDPEVEQYIYGLEYIVVDRLNTYSGDVSYPTVFYWDHKGFDAKYRADNDVFKELLEPEERREAYSYFLRGEKKYRIVFIIELADLIAQRLQSGPLADVPVLYESSTEYKKLFQEGKLKDKEKQLWITFRVGQQLMDIDGTKKLVGAVDVLLNGDRFGPQFNKLDNRFMPEPFVYDLNTKDRESFERALDILVIKVTDYLEYKKRQANRHRNNEKKN